MDLTLTPIGFVHSSIKDREHAPKQGREGAPEAEIRLAPGFEDALLGLQVGEKVLVLTWFDRADRSYLQVHPRGDEARPLRGVFSTRSPDRPNPIGLHEVTITAMQGRMLRVHPLEALDGTPVVDIKCLL